MNSVHRSHRAIFMVALAFLLGAQSAEAHIESGSAGGFVPGFVHPWSGLDHILAMVAVGIWGAQLGAPAIWLLPVAFPMVMAIGGFLGLVGIPLPGAEVGVAVSSILLGLAVGMKMRPHLALAAVAVAIFGLFHGHAHGTELPSGQNAMLYSIGFVVSTGLLHATGILLGEIRRLPLGEAGLRVAGAVIAICGCFFTWNALR